MKFVSMVTNLVDTHVNIMRFQYSVPIDLIVSLGYFRRTEENISQWELPFKRVLKPQQMVAPSKTPMVADRQMS